MTDSSVGDNTRVWSAEVLRVTAFPRADALASSDWWKQVVGREAEMKTQAPGLEQYIGPLEGMTLLLRVVPNQQNRIDWVLSPDVKDSTGLALPILGDFAKSLDAFATAMGKWFKLPTCPSLKRVAFGGLLAQIVESDEAAYKAVSNYLHSVRLEPGISDFMYQVNRRRESKVVPGLKLNRLSTWIVAQVATVTEEIFVGPAGPVPARSTVSQSSHVCRLNLDINTAPEFSGEFARESVPALFSELTVLGIEIARDGDVP